MNALTVPNGVAVALFGIALSAAFCDIHWTKKNRMILAVGSAAMLLMQALITYMDSWTAMQEMYPLITHLPLAIILSVLSGKWLWPTISVLAAYLCCQLRRWVALLIIAMVPGISWLQPAVEIVVTLPLLAVLLRYVAPAARSFARYPRSMQLLFGVVPLAGYLFDYVTRIYTDLLAQGNQAAVEFMPFVCSVAYIVFVLRVSAEERTRSQLEQTRNNLKLQVGQAVREIEALRTSQQQTRAYRHDLRHHLQYISACIENGRGRAGAGVHPEHLLRDRGQQGDDLLRERGCEPYLLVLCGPGGELRCAAQHSGSYPAAYLGGRDRPLRAALQCAGKCAPGLPQDESGEWPCIH